MNEGTGKEKGEEDAREVRAKHLNGYEAGLCCTEGACESNVSASMIDLEREAWNT